MTKPNPKGFVDVKSATSFFLNFPRDNFVTVNRYNQWTKTFGSQKNILEQMRKWIVEGSFVGVMNGPEAEKLVGGEPKGVVMFRISRSTPDWMTLMLKDDEGRLAYEQYRGTDSSLEDYMKKTFPTLKPSTYRFNWEKLDSIITIVDYYNCDVHKLITKS